MEVENSGVLVFFIESYLMFMQLFMNAFLFQNLKL